MLTPKQARIAAEAETWMPYIEARLHADRLGIGRLLGAGSSNARTRKSELAGTEWTTWIMYLSPAESGGYGDLCPKASPGCKAACLYGAGRGGLPIQRTARERKTQLFFESRSAFLALLLVEVAAAERSAAKKGQRAAIRFNGTSDIVWERIVPGMFKLFPDVQFYDYTKIVKRMAPDWSKPSNYHLVFSRSETNEADCERVLGWGGTVAKVYRGELPDGWIDAEEDDLRFLDPPGATLGLVAIGDARSDTSGFVLHFQKGAA